MMQQAKFTYSHLVKAFEKQIKTIGDQGEKQVKPIQNQGQVKTIKKYDDDDQDSPLISKQKEMFNELADKRLNEITELDEEINCDDLIHRYKGRTPDDKFNIYDNALDIIDKIKSGEIKLAEVKSDQINFKSSLGKIKKRNNKKKDHRSKKAQYIILIYFTKQETRLLNFLMIILQYYLKQKINEVVKDLKH